MKRTYRLTALVLALLMLVNLSASATTTGITLDELNIETYEAMVAEASVEEEQPLSEPCSDTNEYCANVTELIAKPTAQDRYDYMQAMYSTDAENVELEGTMLHYYYYKTEHNADGLICECDFPSLAPEYEPGALNVHETECPWTFANLSVAEQYAVVCLMTAEEQEPYIATLSADQAAALETYTAEQEEGNLSYPCEDKPEYCQFSVYSVMTATERYNYFNGIYADENGDISELYAAMMLHYGEYHLDSNLICTCGTHPLPLPEYQIGDISKHETDCPWHFANLTTGEQYTLLNNADETQQAAYTNTLDDTAKEKLTRVNTTEYTAAGEGSSVQISAPSGTFAADYILSAASAALSEAQQAAMDSLAGLNIITSFDISFADLTNEATKLQPTAPVQLTFTVDTSNVHGAVLHVHHLKDNGDGTYTAESLGEVAVDNSQTTQTITVSCPSFSAVTLSEECDGLLENGGCGFADLMAAKDGFERETIMQGIFENNNGFSDLIDCYFAIHSVQGDLNKLICLCSNYELYPANYPYGGLNHETSCVQWGESEELVPCPWHFNQISTAEQLTVLEDVAEEEKADYLATLDEDALAKLNSVNALSHTGTSDGASVQITIPEGAFGDVSYIPSASSTLTDKQLEATATLEGVKVVAAFDISFADLNNESTKLQPSAAVGLSFAIDTSVLEGTSLQVYHLLGDETNGYTVETVGDASTVDRTLTTQTISVSATAFSVYFVGETCDGSACDVNGGQTYSYNEFMKLTTAEARRTYLNELYDPTLGEEATTDLEDFLLHLVAYHPDAIELICTCNIYPIPAIGSADHNADCPWRDEELSLRDHYDIWVGLNDDEKAAYEEQLDAETVDKLERVNVPTYTLSDGEYSVTVTVPEGAFDEYYLLEVNTLTDDLQALVTNAVNKSLDIVTPFSSLNSKSFDIYFESLEDGTEMVPFVDITLTFSVPLNEDESIYELQVYHMDEKSDGTYTAEYVASFDKSTTQLIVNTKEFSIYSVDSVGDTAGTRINANDTVTMNIGETGVFYWIGEGVNEANNYTWVIEDGAGIVEWVVYGTGSSETDPEYGAWPDESYPFIKVTAKAPGTVTVTMKYVVVDNNNQTETSETFYINVLEPDFYIEDQIATNGSIVPAGESIEDWGEDVTYTWSRSDGETIKALALLSNNGVNVAIDRGGITVQNDTYVYVTYTVVAKNSDGTELATATYTVPYGNEILNSSFETPQLSGTTHIQIPNGTEEFFWKTTGVGTGANVARDIELIQNGDTNYTITTAHHGYQFAEVNAENFGTLYQDLLTAPGATLTWEFSHAARTNYNAVNTLYVVMASTEDAKNVIDAQDVNTLLAAAKDVGVYDGAQYTAVIDGETIKFRIWQHVANTYWESFSGTYTVPEGQYLTRLFFASDTNQDGTGSTVGNLIDKTGARETLKYKIEYYINGVLQSEDTQTGNPSAYSYVTADELEDYLSKYALTGVTINGQPYPADVQADDFAGFYIAPYVYSSGDAEYPNIFRLYFKDEAITVTKRVTINNWSELNAKQQQALMVGYKATFGLYKADVPNTLISTVEVPITYAEGQDLLALVEFTTTVDSEPLELENTSYIVKELSATELTGYAKQTTYEDGSTTAPTVTITETERTFNVNCLNAYVFKMGALTITKNVVDSNFPATGKEFTFTVKPLDGQDLTNWLAKNTQYTQIDGGFEVTLPVDSSKTATIMLSELPAGAYEVTETALEDYTTTYKVGDAAETTDKASATVDQDGEVTVLVTNTYKTGDLTLVKKIVDVEGTEITTDTTTEFDVKITLKDTADALVSKTYKLSDGTDVVFTDGVATVKVKYGTNVVIEDIEYGYDFAVAEDPAVKDGYRLKEYQNETGTMTADGHTTTIINYQTTDLSITKKVTGAGSSKSDVFSFKVTLLDGQNYRYTISPVANDAGYTEGELTNNGTVQLMHGQTAVIKDVPVGATYTVVEDVPDDYTTENATMSGKINADATKNTVEYLNVHNQGKLTIKKTFSNGSTTDTAVFIIKSGDNEYQRVSITGTGSVTVALPYGSYTIAEDDWSWNYDTTVSGEQSFTFSKDKLTHEVSYTNTSDDKWLNEEIVAPNVFK